MNEELRFEGELSDEYRLNQVVYSYQKGLQECLGKIISKYLLTRKNPLLLEIGCGTGDTTREVFRYSPDVEINCLDSSKSMIEQVKQNLKEQFDFGKLNFHYQDALDYLKTTKRKYDVVFTAYTLHNIECEKRSEIINNIQNILKKGGLLVDLDIIYSSDAKKNNSEFSWMVNQLEGYVRLGRPDLKDKWHEHFIEDRDPKRIQLENQLVLNLKNSGFEKIKKITRHESDAIYTAVKK